MAGTPADCDGLILGAGPAGLAHAAQMALRGHSFAIVEKSEPVGHQAPAKTINVWSIAPIPRWGSAIPARERATFPPAFFKRIRFRLHPYKAWGGRYDAGKCSHHGLPMGLAQISRKEIAGLDGADVPPIRPDRQLVWRGNRITTPTALVDIMRQATASNSSVEQRG
ncbi:NAD(P)-binding protein [Chachezhania sediminis]|uniref:NAD(P)-binding protein n=1 Tax=Chachezhania sediminis TaxID=2599291 RepID=UPI00131C94FF|nr:NAD(P)-binding protein [Chachezhania sediminis]